MSSLFGIGGGGNVGASSSFYPYSIDQSLRFEDGDSAYLNRTPTSAGNRKTWTWSSWVKRGNISSFQGLFASRSALSDAGYMYTAFITADNFQFASYSTVFAKTSQLFRDSSAWYHIVIAFDATAAAAADRLKIYVNGSEAALSTDNRSSISNQNYAFNQAGPHYISGRYVNSWGSGFDGYLAEINVIDGTALTPASFGETKDGIWIPKAYSGSYGTNGLYLTFQGTGTATTSQGTTAQTNIGDDQSGTGNNFAVSGLASSDVVLDSPTNNWCTLNPIDDHDGTPVFSEGNLRVSIEDNAESFGTFGVSSGKWYWEIRYVSSASNNNKIALGIADADNPNNNGEHNYGHQSTTYAAGDILAVAVDVDNTTFTFYKNNSAIETNTDWSSKGFTTIVPLVTSANNAGEEVCIFNFGQDSSFAGAVTAQGNSDDNGVGDFYYSPPSGFLALASSNLPEPAIIDGTENFNTVLYTGNGGTQTITGVGFQPDLTWVKGRSIAQGHSLYDVIRGYDYKVLSSDSTSAQVTETGGVSAVASDGFTLTGNNTIIGGSNSSGQTYAAWNWLAGTAFSNDASATGVGTIDSSGQVNTKAGFSIVSYVANGTNTGTVAHGLSIEPKIVIQKNRSAASDWLIYTDLVDGSDDYLLLNSTAAKGNAAGGATATVFNSWDRTSGNNMIAYCFHSVEGYSKIGSYTGNGNADGTFIFTGFRPAWVIVKASNKTENWFIFDNKRDTFNVADHRQVVNTSAAESDTLDTLDFLSNGIKFRTNNTAFNGSYEYIYLAFAESPFKFANAR